MPRLGDLLMRLPTIKETRMSAQGYVVWIVWHTDLDGAVNQTLQDYGGMHITNTGKQSLWFFFTSDILLALARLVVWGKFNPLPITMELFPAKLLLGVRREISLEIETLLTQQEIIPLSDLEVWIHPKIRQGDLNIPGISYEKKGGRQGMANLPWAGLDADVRLPYTSSHGWYVILRPLGNPLDKNFQTGWRFMYTAIENILHTNKLKFLLHENFVMISVENLRALRIWLRELLTRCNAIKAEQHDLYWPCVSAVIDRKGMHFSVDLHSKVNFLWDNLVPDFPYMSYRNAYLLGEGFAIQDLRFSGDQTSMDDWCNVVLDDVANAQRAIPLLMAGSLTGGSGGGCFYCGVRSHESTVCPTRLMAPSNGESIWRALGNMDLEVINESFRNIESVLSKNKLEGYAEILSSNGPTSTLLKAILETNSSSQLRTVQKYWLTRGREFPGGQEQINLVRDESGVWECLDDLAKTGHEGQGSMEKELQTAVARNPREPRYRTLLGFLYVDKNDPTRAMNSLKEASAFTASPLLQAWNEYLQARISESQARYPEAIEQYGAVLRVFPQWRDLEYRQLVCKVKMGFAEQILGPLRKMIHDDPTFFNRCLIDPELERGHILILTSLAPMWSEAEKNAEAEKASIQELSYQLQIWFDSEHPVSRRLGAELKELQALSDIKNYVAFLQVCKLRPLIEKELLEHIQKQIEELQERYKNYLEHLQLIRDEASWFPFPKILREFNRAFNECAGIINWAFASNFKEVDSFQRASSLTGKLDSLLRDLKRKLKFLRVVRDTTLFALTLGRTFFWIELSGLLLSFIGVPLVVIYGDEIKLGWLREILGTQQWEIQKVMIIIISVMAIGVAALRTTVVFEKKRDKLLEEARVQREKMQRMRLLRLKKQRAAEQAAKEKEDERMKSMRVEKRMNSS